MTTEQKIIKTKVGALELAKQLASSPKPVSGCARAETASIGSKISMRRVVSGVAGGLTQKPILRKRVLVKRRKGVSVHSRP